MRRAHALAAVLLASVASTSLRAAETQATCNIRDSGLEQAILQNPELHKAANLQVVQDLRALRDAAFILWSYGRDEDCARLLANIRELVTVPGMAALGGNDEGDANTQFDAREPIAQRGGALGGRRDDAGALPLIDIAQLSPGLRADQIIGVEVRSADDRIIGEVRNIVFGTQDRQDYAIVASGGFFTTGRDSYVVPIRSLEVSQDRYSFYLPISEEAARDVPLMPDQDYLWLSDADWRARNDAFFE